MNTCYYCDHRGEEVNRVTLIYVGGKGEVLKHCCDDIEACIKRVESKKVEVLES